MINYMRIFKNLLLSTLVLGIGNSFAATRSYNEILNTAKNALSNSSQINISDVKIQKGDTVCYTFKGDNGGFAIISADTRVPALLAYSKEGNVSPDLQNMLNLFIENIDNNQHQNIVLSSSTNSSSLRATRIEDNPIEPLLKDIAWGQESPFNLNTPEFTDGNAPTGCTATAISQLLYYHRYPETTVSDIPSYITTTEGISIEGITKGTVIDWDNMLDSYENGYTNEQAMAVSNLMSIVGAAVKMDYNATESTCESICMDELVNIFGYDKDLIRISYRSSYTFKEWSQLLYDELKNNRPVLMAGSTMNDGHSFLCDGIDKDGLFHINWGWDGRYNGYYDLALLNPNTTSETGASSSTDGYSKNTYIIHGIVPDNGIADETKETSIVEACSVKHQITNDYHYLFFSYANPSLETKTVSLAGGYIDEDGNVVKVCNIGNYDLKPTSSYTQSTAKSVDLTSFEEGKTYKIGLIESTDGINWSPCDGFNNISYTFIFKDGDLQVAENYELSASVEITDFSYTYQYAHGTIHLSNSGNKEYYNVLYVMTESEDILPNEYSYAAYVTAEANDSNDVDFKFIPTSDTTYYWVLDNNLNVINNGVTFKQNKKYKLTATVKIDTTSTGNRMCRIYLKNEGDAYYDNEVRAALYYSGGSSIITSNVYLEPGKETTINYELNDDFSYTRYSAFDYNAIQFDSGDFVSSPVNSGKVSVAFDFDQYDTSDQIVMATLVITNGTDSLLSTKYYVELDTTGEFRGLILDSFSVDIPANSVEKIPLNLEVGRDSCTLVVYQEGQAGLNFDYYKLIAKKDMEYIHDISIADNSNLKIWAINTTLVAEAIEDTSLLISSINGHILTSRQLHKGEIFQQILPSGVYVVNGKKILLKLY